jgi:DNA-binding transcriptional MerR regulator
MSDMEMKKFIAGQLNAGVSLNEIQKLIAEKFDKRMTFLDLRLLAAELEGVEWQKQDPEPVKAEEPEKAMAAKDTAGKTVVELSKLVRPGAVASGSVKFASGASAEWILDQTGRLGLNNAVGEPTEDDIKDFQKELQKALSKGR